MLNNGFDVQDGVLIRYHGSSDEVKIPDGVRAIGACAFTSFDHENKCLRRSYIRSVSIPNTVVSIDENAFSDCVALESISVDVGDPVYHCKDNCLIETCYKKLIRGTINSKLPTFGEITAIAPHAFAFCEGLQAISIPEGVIEIGTSAFADCISLHSVTLPSTLTKLGLTVFGGCDSLRNITVSANNPIYRSYNGCIVDITAKKLIQGTSYCTIPSDGSVETIGERAFCLCRRLEKLTVPRTVKLIEREAFDQCPLLTELEIPSGVKRVPSETQYTEKQRFATSFGKRLRYARKRKGLTQEQVMALTDVTDKSLSRYENGSSAPSPDVISELMKLYDVSADYLMGFSDIPMSVDPEPSSHAVCDGYENLYEKLRSLSDASLKKVDEYVDMLTFIEKYSHNFTENRS